MKIKQYRKKPLIIEAMQRPLPWPTIIHDLERWGLTKWHFKGDKLIIDTLEGEMSCDVGDYIIKGIEGEFYPVKKSIFEASYEIVNE